MKLKIAVTGAHGVGKSTPIYEFVKRRPEYTVIPEIAGEMLAERRGKVEPWPGFQTELMWRKMRAEKEHRHLENLIADRTAVDNWAYCAYYRAFPEMLLDVLKDLAVAYCNSYYDLFAYIPADDPVITRSGSAEKRAFIDAGIRSLLPVLGEVLTLRGTVGERVEALVSHIEKRGPGHKGERPL